MKKFELNGRYKAIQDYHYEALPIVYDLKKGDIVIFKGRSFGGTAIFYKVFPQKIKLEKENYRFENSLVIIGSKTALRTLVPLKSDRNDNE